MTVFYAFPISVDDERAALIENFGAVPLEGGGELEDEGEVDVAVGVDVSPVAIMTDGSEPLGEMVGLFEGERNDEFTIEVDISQAAVFFDESEGVVVDVFVSFSVVVFVFEREDGEPDGVDDAVVVVDAGEGTSEAEKANLVVFAGDDFVAIEVEEALFIVARDADAVLGDGGDWLIEWGSELDSFGS